MKPQRRKEYPPDWEAQAYRCKQEAGWRCIVCRVQQNTERISPRTGVVYPVYLHAAHRDHDKGNPRPALLCLCPTCHGLYDAYWRSRQQRISLERLRHLLLRIRKLAASRQSR